MRKPHVAWVGVPQEKAITDNFTGAVRGVIAALS
jgi:hypothetical protein